MALRQELAKEERKNESKSPKGEIGKLSIQLGSSFYSIYY